MTAARNPFEALFQSDEYKAREAAYQRARADRRAAFLDEHGDERIAFRDTEMEEALRDACEPLMDSKEVSRGFCRLAGWDACDSFDDMPPELCAAVTDAWSIPATVAEAWTEFQATETRRADRAAFAEGYEPPAFVEARQRVVEELLNAYPARDRADLLARISWLECLNELGAPRVENQRARLETLRLDIERVYGGPQY